MRRRKIKKDASHDEVVQHLKDHSVVVEDAAATGHGFPDLITFWREAVFIEIKVHAQSMVQFTQLKFMAKWPGPVGFAIGGEQALRLAKDPGKWALTSQQKYRLQQLVDEFPGRENIRLHLVTARLGIVLE